MCKKPMGWGIRTRKKRFGFLKAHSKGQEISTQNQTNNQASNAMASLPAGQRRKKPIQVQMDLHRTQIQGDARTTVRGRRGVE
uniref:Uncharacterized protein n=1 Tax=Arundo donax TaxID=35708 RepID=A0A0A9GBJ2_ARUDO